MATMTDTRTILDPRAEGLGEQRGGGPALEHFEHELGADGALRVRAAACAACLAPSGVIAAVARSCLEDGSPLASREIEVRLPTGAGGEPGT